MLTNIFNTFKFIIFFCNKYKVILIFDEIRTGFRISMGGAQKYYGVTPDLGCFGKAMANGYSISVVTGKTEIMNKGEKEVFVSSTFIPNSLSYVAALKTIEILERDCVLEKIWAKGKIFMQKVKGAIDKYNIGAELSGIPPMMFISFKKDREKVYKKKRMDFYTQLIRRKVFMQPYHHSYIAYRHTQEDLDYSLKAINESLEYLKVYNFAFWVLYSTSSSANVEWHLGHQFTTLSPR